MGISEKALIRKILLLADTARNSSVRKGIGDDCAVLHFPLRRGKQCDTLVTTDFTLEGVHFRREWHPPESVGHRCLARGLSDIAAMGGEPVAVFLSLALPRDTPQKWINRFSQGLLKLAKKYKVTFAGGDTAESPGGILADIVVLGTVPAGQAVLRSGARPGHRIYVSGELGGSAATVAAMLQNPKRKLIAHAYSRQFFPDPRIELGRILRERKLVSAMIDTSDGLSTDLAHICEESGVGAELQEEWIPQASLGGTRLKVGFEFALHGGEDYELLFTAPPNKKIPSRIAGVPITQIGRITSRGKMFLVHQDGSRRQLKAQGWEHFRE